MKLATLKTRSRDGELLVVSRDLARAVRAGSIARTLQEALDDWAARSVALRDLAERLERDAIEGSFALDPTQLASPLPRAFQFLDGSVYLHHMEKARKARGVAMPPNYETDPLMYQGLSDRFDGPRDPMVAPDPSLGLDYEPEVAVILDDVPMGTKVVDAGKHIVMVMLLNDFTYRTLTQTELPKGFGFLQAKPTSSFSPVALTPDELGDAWDGTRLSLPILSTLNGRQIGRANAGKDMFFDYPRLIAHAARTRSLSAGTILGAGAISNKDRSTGHACLAELRLDEANESGAARTPWLGDGDVIRIEMLDANGHSLFGAIEQKIVMLNKT